MDLKPRINKASYLTLFLILLLSLAAFVSLERVLPHAFITSALAPSDSFSWIPTVSLVHNAYLSWRIDPFIQGINQLFLASLTSQYWNSFTLHLIIFSFGLFSLFSYRATRLNYIESATVSSILSISIIWLFGLDIIIIGSIVWIPLVHPFTIIVWGKIESLNT